MTEQRWHLRFDNFCRAVDLLDEGIALLREPVVPAIVRDGVQRFEYTWELAWKTMRDFLQIEGVTAAMHGPASVVRVSAEARLIDNPDLWIEAKNDRNLSSHEYDEERINALLARVAHAYLPAFKALRAKLQPERDRGN